MSCLLAVLELHREKMSDIQRRWIHSLEQLRDEDVNWRPNDMNNSIGNLTVHVAGSLRQRFVSGIGQRPDIRKRDEEFNTRKQFTKNELVALLTEQFGIAHEAMQGLTPEQLSRVYWIKDHNETALDVIFEVVTHVSEHLGQVLYIAKMRLGDKYQVQWAPHNRK